MARNRVEVTDLPGPQPLRPVQPNVDTYAGYEKPVIDNDMARLGEALSGFSVALRGLGRGRKEDPNDPRLATAYATLSGLKDPDAVQRLQTGQLPHMDYAPVRHLYEHDVGGRAARQVLDDVRLGVQDGTIPLVDNEGRPVDIQAIIAERGRKSFELFPNSVPFQKAFNATIDSNRNTLADMARTKVAEVNKERNTVLVQSALEDIVTAAKDPDANDRDIAAELDRRFQAAYKVTGTRAADTQDLFMARVQKLAKEDPDAAERLLRLDRGISWDGQKPGPLIASQKHRKAVDDTLITINNEREQRLDVAVKEQATAEARRRLENKDGFNQITDYYYTNPYAQNDPSKSAQRHISKSELQDRALGTFLQDSDAFYSKQVREGVPDLDAQNTKMRREYEAFVHNNRPHPRWAAQIADTGRILTNPASLSDPANVARVEATFQLYDTLSKRNPGYMTETLGLKDREQKFFDQYSVYKTLLGDTPSEAAKKAADFINNPPPPLTGDEAKTLRDKADRIDFAKWWPGGGVNNTAVARAMIFDTAKAIAADRRIPVEKAIDAAAEMVVKRSTRFNDQIIPPNPYLTNETAPHYQTRLNELFKANEGALKGQGVTSPSDLSLRLSMTGQRGVFDVIDKDGQRVITPDFDKDGKVTGYSSLYVRSEDIENIQKQSESDARAKALRESEIKTLKAIIDRPTTRAGGPSKERRENARKRLAPLIPGSPDEPAPLPQP
jgi:hypothetical protein